MAFCTRSERKIILSNNENSLLGPGQYLMMEQPQPKENKYKYTRIKKKVYPIKKSNEDVPNLQLNQSNSNISLNSPMTLNGSSIISNSTKEYSNTNNINNNSTGIFISSEERFQNKNKKDQFPGPGKYIDIQKEYLQKVAQFNKTKKKSIKNELYKTGQLNRVVSIQSKSMNGYSVDKQNKALINMKNIVESPSSTSPLIGPGTYNIIDKAKNTQVKWIRPKSKKKDKLKNDIMKEIVGDDINSFRNTKNVIRYNINDLIHKKLEYDNSINDLKKTIKSNNKLYDLVGNVPGPGFYQEEFSFDPIDENEKKKTVKTSQHLFKNLGKDIPNKNKEVPLNRDSFLFKNKSYTNIGPGSYFLPKTMFESMSQKKLINDKNVLVKYNFDNIKSKTHAKLYDNNNDNNKIPFVKKDEDYSAYDNTVSTFTKETNPYNNMIKSYLFYRNFVNKNASFNSKKDETPGPGAYINLDYPLNTKELIKKHQKNITNVFGTNAARNTGVIFNNNVPGVGKYDLNDYNSIYHDNILKLKSKTRRNEGFLQSSSRFIRSNSNIEIGPSTYNPKFDYTYNKKYLAPFDTSSKKFNYKNNFTNDVGPGQYNIISQSWNKKSFNKLFC